MSKAYKMKTLEPTLRMKFVEVMYKNTQGLTRREMFDKLGWSYSPGYYNTIFIKMKKDNLYEVKEGTQLAKLTDIGKKWYEDNLLTDKEINKLLEERREKREELDNRKEEIKRHKEEVLERKERRENKKEYKEKAKKRKDKYQSEKNKKDKKLQEKLKKKEKLDKYKKEKAKSEISNIEEENEFIF